MASIPKRSAVARAACAGRSLRSARSASSIRRAIAAASPGWQIQPLVPCSITSAAPQRALTIAGSAIASASGTVLGKGSERGGRKKQSAAAQADGLAPQRRGHRRAHAWDLARMKMHEVDDVVDHVQLVGGHAERARDVV